MLLSEYVPLVLTSAAIAVTSIGVIEGCGTNSIADFVTVTELVPVPTTPLLSRYVTMTGMVIVAVTFVGFLLRFFSEIIIPTILALFLFQISKVIVLWLHRPILPYLSYEVEEVPDEEKMLINSDVRLSIELLLLESPKEAGMEVGDSLSFCLFYCNSASSSDYLPPIYHSNFRFSNCVVFLVIRFNHLWSRTTKSMLFMPKK